MSSLIEKAAQRLEQLRKAGVDIDPAPEAFAPAAPHVSPVAPQGSPVAPRQAPATARAAPAPEVSSRSVALNLDALVRDGYVTPEGAARDYGRG